MKNLKQVFETRLNKMEGKEFMYNGNLYKVRRWTFSEEGILTIRTETKHIECPFGEHEQFIEEWLPVCDEKDVAVIPREETQIMVFEKPELKVLDDDTMGSLKEILLENIAKLKNDKSFVPQAYAINEHVQSFIGLAKVEIEAIKMLTHRSKMGRPLKERD